MSTVFPETTPAELGYRMPAEWESQEAIWYTWPHADDTWPEVFPNIPHIFAEMVFHLSKDQLVKINVLDADHEAEARAILEAKGVNLPNVKFYQIPSNDSWCRDHGPTFVVRDVNGKKEKALISWNFNSWGGKYPYELDNAVPENILKYEPRQSFHPGIVLEGGSIEVNGAGTVLTTRACLLNKNRNPHLTQTEIEDYLKSYLNVQQVLWLEDGILGDDTDGHIDDLSRFVNENTIVTIVEDDTTDGNHVLLEENLALLKEMKNLDGKSFNIITLPMPKPVVLQGIRLPASYANFLIANKVVLVPTFNDPNDQKALDILQACFPTRKVIGINCRELVLGLGTLHCVSQQEPAV